MSGCGTQYTLEIQTPLLSWTPKLKADLVPVWAEMTEGLIYQEKDAEEADTLLIIQEDHQKVSLSSYVQAGINQLKLEGYLITHETTKKGKLSGKDGHLYSTLLKRYHITEEEKTLIIAQLFILREDDILLLSYASERPEATKAFVKALSSLQLRF